IDKHQNVMHELKHKITLACPGPQCSERFCADLLISVGICVPYRATRASRATSFSSPAHIQVPANKSLDAIEDFAYSREARGSSISNNPDIGDIQQNILDIYMTSSRKQPSGAFSPPG